MPLPLTLNPAAPAGADSPSLGDDEFRALKDYLISVFGAPNNVAITSQAFSITTTGQVTVSQTPFTVPSFMQGTASTLLVLKSQYTGGEFQVMIGAAPTNLRIGGWNGSGMLLYGRFLQSSNAAPFVIGTTTTATMVLQTNSTDRVSIDNTGAVALLNNGLTVYTGGMSVFGAASINSGNLTIGQQQFITGTGRLGIGTSAPTQSLHMAGWSFFATRIDIGGHIRCDANVSGRLVLPVGTGLYAS